MKLSVFDIQYVRYDLKNRGLSQPDLFEELVDHVCCEVELEMARGIPFKVAYEKILAELPPSELATLQDKVIRSQNYKPTRMLSNTWKIMFRNLKKHSVHTVINVAGLVLGFTCFIVIALYVKHEVGYDRQFIKSASIYRITMSSTVGGTDNFIPTAYPALAPAIEARSKDVTSYTRIINYKYTRMVPTFRFNENVFYEDKVIFADSTFFNLFDFPFIAGNPATALSHPNSVVITEGVAHKYFGDADALGKHLNFNGKVDLEVTGVLQDLPSNTHLQFDFVIPLSGIGNSGVFQSAGILENWNVDWFWTYLTIPDPARVADVERDLNMLASEKIKDTQQEFNLKFYIQPLRDIHLHSHFDYNTDLTQNGDINNLFIFISVGVLVLLISAINFINITMATATRRYKEIGVSKVLGAMKFHLRLQFLLESISICLVSLGLAFLLAPVVLPLFSQLLGVSLRLNVFKDVLLMSGITLFTIVVGIASGMYPAFFVSSLEPQRVLKGVWKPGQGGANFRKALIGLQIVISIFLIIGTLVIWEQLRFMQNKSLGYDQDQIVMLTIRGTNLSRSYHAFKNKLQNETSIQSVTSVSEPIGREVQFMSFTVEGQEKTQFIKILNVTHDFVKTMGLEIVQGRDFSRDNPNDSISGFIINEAAARSFGWNEPVGKSLDHSFRSVKQGSVIGVVKDFNFEPLQKQIDPIVIWFGRPFWYAAVKIQPGHTAEALASMEKAWKNLEPEKPFSFQFLNQSIQHVYDKEQRLSKVFLFFSMLSIVTAVLGLYGLISFIAEQRLAEIGIRKVMGASVKSILLLLSKEYVVLVVTAFVVSAPLTYLILNQWLQTFAFRIAWSPIYFVAGLFLSGLIVLATVVLKAMRAAGANPAEVLRME